MKNAIEYLTDLNIDMSNRIRAVQGAGSVGFDENTYREVIRDLTGRDDEVADEHTKHTFMYLVEQIATNGVADFDLATENARKYVAKNPWVLAKPEHTSTYVLKSTVDALGKPKQKKGAKKAAAQKFWKENQGKFNTRNEWIEALMEAVGLTKAAASTYHYNLKKQIW